MRGRARRSLLALGAAVAVAGCGAADPDGAREAAEAFYAAHAQRDGAAACALLSSSTRTQLEHDEQRPCVEAVLDLKLEHGRSVGSSTFVTEAKVDLAGGDSVFLEEMDVGWRVSAAGCRPVPDEEAPYECEVES